MRNTSRKHLFTTSVTVEEQVKGRLAYINRFRNSSPKSAVGHAALVETVLYFHSWNILLYEKEADALVQGLRRQRIRISSQDLRIAAIALLHGYTIVTSNRHDFIQVPGLKVEDWAVRAGS